MNFHVSTRLLIVKPNGMSFLYRHISTRNFLYVCSKTNPRTAVWLRSKYGFKSDSEQLSFHASTRLLTSEQNGMSANGKPIPLGCAFPLSDSEIKDEIFYEAVANCLVTFGQKVTPSLIAFGQKAMARPLCKLFSTSGENDSAVMEQCSNKTMTTKAAINHCSNSDYAVAGQIPFTLQHALKLSANSAAQFRVSPFTKNALSAFWSLVRSVSLNPEETFHAA